MEKTSIVTNRETKISKMEINQTEQAENGVLRNIKSEVVTESSVIKTEIVMENIGCGKSKLSKDASVDQNNTKLKTELNVPLPDISRGDNARIGEVTSNGMSSNSGTSRRTTVANGATGESKSYADQFKNSCENRKISKKRKTHDDKLDISNHSFVLRDSRYRRSPLFENFRRRSTPFKDRLELINVSQEFGEEEEKAANMFCTNKICSPNSANAMKNADELMIETSSSCSLKRSKETEKGNDDSQTGEAFINTENSPVNSLNVPSSSKERNGSCTKEESRRKFKVMPFNRSCKKELIKNLEKSVTDLVNYFENLQHTSLERNSRKLADNMSEKSISTAKKKPRTENKNPGKSANTLSPIDKYTRGSRENFTKADKDKMLDGSTKLTEDLPCVLDNNLKHYPKERILLISEQAPTPLPPKKDNIKYKSAICKKEKHRATVDSRNPITYFGIILFVVLFAASSKFLLALAEKF